LQGKYDYIEQNLIRLRKKISSICTDCGRDAKEIYIVAVSKTFPPEIIAAAMDFNQLDFGENRVQELISKQKQFEDRIIHWHLIGHLQTNKVKYIVPFVFMIHSVDSFKLAQKINSEASKIKRAVKCLIQVNTTGEEQKSGCSPKHALKIVKEISQLEYVKIKGLMTIAKLMSDEKDQMQRNEVRENFRLLKNIFDEISSAGIENTDMKYLSMGMTSDYDIALEEGSNMLRIGSAIFGQRLN
jgi:pyridoxal phosphate enzyme (YggS family)